MKSLLILFTLFSPLAAIGQLTTEYLDSDWNPCPKENASFYREISYDKTGKPIGKVRDYFITGELQFEGTLLSVDPDTLDGICIWYYRNGQKEQEGTFMRGSIIKKVREWSEQGKEEGVLDVGEYFFSKDYLIKKISLINKLAETEFKIDSSTVIYLLMIGKHQINKGNLELSNLLFRIVHDISISENNIEAQGISYNNIGLVYDYKGQFEEALTWYRKAIDIQQHIGAETDLGTSYNNIGSIYHSKGQFEEALTWYGKAIDVQHRLNLEVALANSYNNIGLVYHSKGQFEKALSWYYKAKKILINFEIGIDLAISYNNIGGIYYSKKLYAEALEWFSKAIVIQQRLNLEIHLAHSYNNLGNIYHSLGHLQDAISWYHKAQKIQQDLNLEIDLARSYNNIGSVFLSQNKMKKALQSFNQSVKIRKQLDSKIDLTNSYENVSLLHFNINQLDSALFYVKKNIYENEKLRGLNRGGDSRQFYIMQCHCSIKIGISSAYPLTKFDDAFIFSEKGKARRLTDLLSETSINPSNVSNDLKTSYESIQIQLSVLNNNLNQEMPIAQRENLIKLRDSVYFERQEREDQIKVLASEYANLIYPETVDKNQVQSILQNDEVLISFAQGYGEIFALILTSSQIKMIALGPSDSLQLLVDQFRSEFIEGQKKALTKNDIFLNKQLKYDFFQNASQLYQKLWAPLETTGLLVDKKIIIVPDGILHYLPFELLIKDKEQKQYADYEYLIKEYPISYYPSATVLHFERTREREKPTEQKDFFGLAVENFEDNHCYENKQYFPSLSYASQEIKSIANCFAPEQRHILFDLEASEEQLKAIDLRQYRYLHFSTHGLINSEKPDFSRLLLQPSASQDGCLDLYEIFDLKLQADLVTLSACETGLGQLVRGEGMVGFTRALMYAGTPSVMLSLWEVADASTAELFANYYAQLQQSGGTDKYQALRNTQLKMIKSEQYANPYYWAPFVFIGATNSYH